MQWQLYNENGPCFAMRVPRTYTPGIIRASAMHQQPAMVSINRSRVIVKNTVVYWSYFIIGSGFIRYDASRKERNNQSSIGNISAALRAVRHGSIFFVARQRLELPCKEYNVLPMVEAGCLVGIDVMATAF